MLPFLLLSLFASGLSFAFTLICRKTALFFGLVDEPDRIRKVHPIPVPRLGGVAVLAGMAAAAVSIAAAGAGQARAGIGLLFMLWPALLIVSGTGLIDDLYGLTPRQKLIGQVGAAAAACWAGVVIAAPGGGAGWWHIPLTMAWLVGCSNALNLIDGMDGLATGIGFIAAAGSFAAGILCGDSELALAAALIAGALLGFLPLNLSPASIFLGDSGSLSVGFLLGCLGVVWANNGGTLAGMAAPAMALVVPLMDTATAIARRFLRGQPIFSSDRGHVHHRLLERGLSPRQTILVLYAATAAGTALAVVQTSVRPDFHGLLVVIFCGAAWLGIRVLRYDEFAVATALLRQIDFRTAVRARLRLRALSAELSRCTRAEEQWRVLQKAAREFGFSDIVWRSGGETRVTALARADDTCWRLHVPLGGEDALHLGCRDGSSARRNVMLEFAECVRASFAAQQVRAGQVSAERPEPAAPALAAHDV